MANRVATTPTGRVLYQFTPLKNFADIVVDEDGDPVIRSKYVEGMQYSVREGNDELHQKVQKWILEQLVRMGGA